MMSVDDVAERRLTRQHLGRQPVHVRRPRIDTGIEQGGEAALDVAVVAHRQRRDADDACLPRTETRRLDVDDRPSPHRRRWRSAGGDPRRLAHVSRMTRCARQARTGNAACRPPTFALLDCRGWLPPEGRSAATRESRCGGQERSDRGISARGRVALGAGSAARWASRRHRSRRRRDDRRPRRDDAGPARSCASWARAVAPSS